MEYSFTKRRHRLSLGQTLMVCGVIYALYRIFKSPGLDREIGKFVEKESDKNPI
jgi:hypothetical protein